MKQIYSENTKKILQNKESIENSLRVKIHAEGKVIFVEGKAEDEYLAIEFIEAVNLGFPINKALLLNEEGFIFQKIPIKAITKRENLSQVRARVIGVRRKALNTIEDLTDCDLVVHGNIVGIIGLVENVNKATYALKHIIAGSKHSVMYGYLEKKKVEERLGF